MSEQQPNRPRSPLDDFMHHQRRAGEETYRAFEALLPPGFREHAREARREFLTSFKVLAEGVVAEVDRQLQKSRPSGEPKATTGKSKVKVEVS